MRNGFAGAVEEARLLGCESFQMFGRSPRMWAARAYRPEEFVEFKKAREKACLFPVVVHGPYLPNLCTSWEELYERSYRVFKEDLEVCGNLGVEYLVIHPGAYSPESDRETGISRLVSALRKVLKEVPNSTMILIENMAGGGRRIGARFEELKSVLEQLEWHPRLGVCFDTCHALGAGYEVNSSAGVEKVMKEFGRHLDPRLIKVFHVNDSKTPLGSHRDRHEHLGKGYVGAEGFRALLTRSEFKWCAGILETPKDSPQADPSNLRVLKGFLRRPS